MISIDGMKEVSSLRMNKGSKKQKGEEKINE
jgi:hypothetical protein